MMVLMMIVLLPACTLTTESPDVTDTASTTDLPTTRVTTKRAVPLAPSELATAIGITSENYPFIDGSTSTLPLVQGIYCNMFNPIAMESSDEGVLFDDDTRMPPRDGGYLGMPTEAAKTVASYEKLIAGKVDLIIVPDPSDDVKQQAIAAGVELEYIPIGMEGLVFITSGKNPVDSVTVEQIVNIYSDGTITNWADLGGKSGRIIPLSRNRDSGSHAQMENLVLRGKAVRPEIAQEPFMVGGMIRIIEMMEDHVIRMNDPRENIYALGYSVFYYVQRMQIWHRVGNKPLDIKMLAVDGVTPTAETIASKEYKLVMGYFAVIRKDEPADSPARKIVGWLISHDGQRVVMEAGLGVLKPVAGKPPR